jgi:type IV pilus assembly protein PilE
MRYCRGFTLIELMVVVTIVAVIAAVGYPSYREHIARGQRSQGQQFLADVAQRQEQFLLDRRQYATALTGAGSLGMSMPDGIKYDAPAFTVDNVNPPIRFTICMSPTAGSYLAARNDGRICVDSTGQRWREALPGNGTFDTGTDCPWQERSCRIPGEG